MYYSITLNGKRVGSVRDGIWYKNLDGSKHFLRYPPGIAFAPTEIDQATNAGAKQLEVKDRETGKLYRTTLVDLCADGFEINRGYGKQIALPFKYWNRQQAQQLGLLDSDRK